MGRGKFLPCRARANMSLSWQVCLLVVLPTMETIDISDPALPMAINLSVAGIRTAVSANKQAAIDAAQVGYGSGWINLSRNMKWTEHYQS